MLTLFLQAADDIRSVYSNLINCYTNRTTTGAIFLIPKEESIEVTWGTVSILDANLLGYQKLLEANKVFQI